MKLCDTAAVDVIPTPLLAQSPTDPLDESASALRRKHHPTRAALSLEAQQLQAEQDRAALVHRRRRRQRRARWFGMPRTSPVASVATGGLPTRARGVPGEKLYATLTLNVNQVGFPLWREWSELFQVLSPMEAEVVAERFAQKPRATIESLLPLVRSRREWCAAIAQFATTELAVLSGVTVFVPSEGRAVLRLLRELMDSYFDGSAPVCKYTTPGAPDAPSRDEVAYFPVEKFLPEARHAFRSGFRTHLSPAEYSALEVFAGGCGVLGADIVYTCFQPLLAKRIAIHNRLLKCKSLVEQIVLLSKLSVYAHATRCQLPKRSLHQAVRDATDTKTHLASEEADLWPWMLKHQWANM